MTEPRPSARRSRSQESPKRSLVKALCFRALATLTTIALVYIFTGALEVAFAVGGIEVVAKLALYYLHERFWSGVDWGLRDVEEAEERAPARGPAKGGVPVEQMAEG